MQKIGGGSAIQVNLIALALHNLCKRFISPFIFMQPVLNFAALTASLKAKGRRWRVAVVCGTDRATLEALMRGTAEGFIEPWLFIPENFNLKN